MTNLRAILEELIGEEKEWSETLALNENIGVKNALIRSQRVKIPEALAKIEGMIEREKLETEYTLVYKLLNLTKGRVNKSKLEIRLRKLEAKRANMGIKK